MKILLNMCGKLHIIRGTVLACILLVSTNVVADELVMKFKNPSFSGIGTSSHYLTIENQEKSRKDKIKDDIEAELLRLKREEENSTLNKFLRNLESRIYSQLSKQLVDNMFGNEEGANFGTFLIEGNTVTYERLIGEDGVEFIRLTIVDAEGSTTTIASCSSISIYRFNRAT